MINFTSNGNSVSIKFIGNPRYLNAGTIEVPLNSLALEFDGSGLALFKKAANGDVLFQCFPSETNLATREAIETFYTSYMVSTGGGGSGTGAVDSVNGKTGVVVLSATDVGAVAKTDFDSFSASTQAALEGKADNAEFEAFSASVETDITNLEKQDTAIGSEIASHEQAFNSYTAKTDTAIAGKQDTLVSGANIKTINGQTLLGEGNIDIQGGGGGGTSYTAGEGINISEANEISVDKASLAIPTAQTDEEGTSANYIYSHTGDTQYRAIATLTQTQYNADTIAIRGRYWGEPSSSSQLLTTLSAATTGRSGVMSSTDKAKLDSIPEGSTIALKSEIPSLEGYLTKASADTVYQPIGDYVTGEEMSAYTYDKATIDGKITGGGTFDPTNYYTKTDVNGLLDDKVDTTAYTQYTGSVQTALEGKADKSAVPTLQADKNGTSANYIYSESGLNQTHSVISKAVIQAVGSQLVLITRNWGDDGNGTIATYIPDATTTVDGLMAFADKAKLDGLPSEAYSKTEIDDKIGDIESLLAAI